MFDDTLLLSNEQYNNIISLCKDKNIYIVDINNKLNINSDNVHIIKFNKNNYLMADKIHLTDIGNKELANLIINNVK